MTALESAPAGPLTGAVFVPGDKSISHRALLIGASAVGKTRVSGLLEADDVMNTAAALRKLGIELRKDADIWNIQGAGVGGLAAPDDIIDCGNAGTCARLLLGLMATHPFQAHVTGDASLRERPMERIITPLSHMGAEFLARNGGRLPLLLKGTPEPLPITYEVPVPSAQVKSAILLAGLNAPGRTTVRERAATRDHTENLLGAFGAEIERSPLDGGGNTISIKGYPELGATDIEIPGDPSSAAFPAIAALLVPDSEIVIQNVGINPLRSGFLSTLQDMKANLEIFNKRLVTGEPVADISVRYGPLHAVSIPPERAPSMIDEYPVVAVAAAFASGTTRMCGVGELRVKESDRFAAIIDGLTACGIEARADHDDILIEGCGGPPAGDATIAANLDHRIAMAFLIMGMGARQAVRIDNAASIATSFPGFVDLMNRMGGDISETDV